MYYTHKHHKHSRTHTRTHGSYISKLTVRVLALRVWARSLSVICARLIAVSWDFSFSCSSLCGKKRSDIYQASASKAKHASARINDPLNEAGNDLSSRRVHIWFSKHNFKLLHPLQNGDFVIGIPAVACGSRNVAIDALPHIFCTHTLFLSVTHQIVSCGGDLALQMSYWFAFPRRATGAGTSLCLFVSSQPCCCFHTLACIRDRKCPLFGVSAA